METKFDFNDGSSDDLKKNASGLFKSTPYNTRFSRLGSGNKSKTEDPCDK